MTGNPFDMRDVQRLQRHLARVIPEARRNTRSVVVRGAMNIKKEWRQNARQSAPKHAPYYPRTVGYDVLGFGPDQVLAIIGPDKSKTQGALGNILEYGSVKNPPHNDGGRALINELPRFEAQMALILQRGLTWW
ncbi:hypothetical protein ACIA74_14035 [Streptomyces sp. NPDC051658]|uniref:hypothetical protein n=1 Tax=Streptomyces sp. NPDC051658 TaxID=3365667 RepID=UPI00378B912D